MFAVADAAGVLRDPESGSAVPAGSLAAAGEVQLFFPGARTWLYGMLHLPQPEHAQDLGMVDLPPHPRASQGGLLAGVLMVVIGLAYMVLNAWWIRSAIRRPPPTLEQLLTPEPPPAP